MNWREKGLPNMLLTTSMGTSISVYWRSWNSGGALGFSKSRDTWDLILTIQINNSIHTQLGSHKNYQCGSFKYRHSSVDYKFKVKALARMLSSSGSEGATNS